MLNWISENQFAGHKGHPGLRVSLLWRLPWGKERKIGEREWERERERERAPLQPSQHKDKKHRMRCLRRDLNANWSHNNLLVAKIYTWSRTGGGGGSGIGFSEKLYLESNGRDHDGPSLGQHAGVWVGTMAGGGARRMGSVAGENDRRKWKWTSGDERELQQLLLQWEKNETFQRQKK